MDKKTAEAFIDRIEANRAAEKVIWDEMRQHPDYEMHEDKVIESILNARENAHRLLSDAEADLGSFDLVEDKNGDFVPREELSA